jgi:aspartate/methionine/tyrosine aminotransferase
VRPFRAEIEALEQNGITGVALPHLGDPEIIPLWFGEGDRVTPSFIRERAKRALDEGDTFYTHTRGRGELRDALKAYLDALYGIDLDPDRISVPGSAMLGITIAVQMALSSGDHALIVSPNWPNIEATCRVTGAQVGFVRQRETASGWALTAREIAEAARPNTRALFVNSPCNPTGWVMPPEEQAELLSFCRDRGILLIADEVYHRTVHEGRTAPSFLSLARDDDPVVVVNGFSKAWAMTGWRIGWVVAPKRHATHWALLSECFNTGATVFVQAAAIAALGEGEPLVRELQQSYRLGREIVLRVLGTHPSIELTPPQGAFYAFPRVPGLASSLEFARALVRETKVGVAPGYTFGPGNDEYFRVCFAQSHERLEAGLKRIARYLDAQRAGERGPGKPQAMGPW